MEEPSPPPPVNNTAQTRCLCGCGQYVKAGNRFVKSHQLRVPMVRKPRGPNKVKKPRKYKKRDKEYWKAKENNHPITSYIAPVFQKQIDEIQKTLIIHSIDIGSLSAALEAVKTAMRDHTEKIEMLGRYVADEMVRQGKLLKFGDEYVVDFKRGKEIKPTNVFGTGPCECKFCEDMRSKT